MRREALVAATPARSPGRPRIFTPLQRRGDDRRVLARRLSAADAAGSETAVRPGEGVVTSVPTHLDPAALASPIFCPRHATRETSARGRVKSMFEGAWRALNAHSPISRATCNSTMTGSMS